MRIYSIYYNQSVTFLSSVFELLSKRDTQRLFYCKSDTDDRLRKVVERKQRTDVSWRRSSSREKGSRRGREGGDVKYRS